jgi:flagellar protein FliJ
MKALHLAIDQATRKRDHLLRALAQAQAQQRHGQDQLDQLTQYAQDTDTRWIQSPSTSPEVMRHHYQFMDRLQHAIAMQEGVIRNLQAHVEHAQRAVQEAQTRVAGLQQVVEQRLARARATAARREQRTMDDMAAQQHRTRSGALSFGD